MPIKDLVPVNLTPAGFKTWVDAISDAVDTLVGEPPALTLPSGLAATPGDGQVSLSWTAGGNATGHRVWRHTSSNFGASAQVGTDLGAAANSYVDATALNDIGYFYWVTAFNATAETSPAGPVTATPTAGAGVLIPTNLQLVAAPPDVNLTWTLGTGATGHRVYRGTTDVFASATQLGTDLGAAAAAYTDSTANLEVTNFYWVTAFDGGGESAPLGPVNTTAAPATGGTTVTNAGGYRIHVFDASADGPLVVNSEIVGVEYLVVGGGAGGGARSWAAGGGGAGGLRKFIAGEAGNTEGSALTLAAGSYAITVGTGGAGGLGTGSNPGANGLASSIAELIVSAGGGGGGSTTSLIENRIGRDGGSGGGGGAHALAGAGGAATPAGQGNAGGTSFPNEAPASERLRAGGGGGGAGANGANGVENNGGNGGAGIASSITGASVTYAGGGGGGNGGFALGGTRGVGGVGGGGNGGFDGANGPTFLPQNGVDGLGGGGGGTGDDAATVTNAGNGGSGVVVIRYPF